MKKNYRIVYHNTGICVAVTFFKFNITKSQETFPLLPFHLHEYAYA